MTVFEGQNYLCKCYVENFSWKNKLSIQMSSVRFYKLVWISKESDSGPLFAKQNLEIGYYDDRMSASGEVPVKFQSNWKI